MTLQKPTFAYLTSITLDSRMSRCYEVNGYPMQLAAASVRFFAAHCPRLLHFTYTLHLHHLLDGPDSNDGIADIARSYDILASACENFEVIRHDVTIPAGPWADWATPTAFLGIFPRVCWGTRRLRRMVRAWCSMCNIFSRGWFRRFSRLRRRGKSSLG
jgi:hypothetical protein